MLGNHAVVLCLIFTLSTGYIISKVNLYNLINKSILIIKRNCWSRFFTICMHSLGAMCNTETCLSHLTKVTYHHHKINLLMFPLVPTSFRDREFPHGHSLPNPVLFLSVPILHYRLKPNTNLNFCWRELY